MLRTSALDTLNSYQFTFISVDNIKLSDTRIFTQRVYLLTQYSGFSHRDIVAMDQYKVTKSSLRLNITRSGS